MSNKKELQLKEDEKSQELLDTMYTNLAKRCGGKSKEFGEMIYSQISRHCSPNLNIGGIVESIIGINPKDHVECMLATQMIATHNMTMRCFNRAVSMVDVTQIVTLELANNFLNTANKLSRTYTIQMESLNRYRGKGQQKMTVEHVHINEGGKAIIGNINSTKEIKTPEDGKGEV
jgi:hypothetical protein